MYVCMYRLTQKPLAVSRCFDAFIFVQSYCLQQKIKYLQTTWWWIFGLGRYTTGDAPHQYIWPPCLEGLAPLERPSPCTRRLLRFALQPLEQQRQQQLGPTAAEATPGHQPRPRGLRGFQVGVSNTAKCHFFKHDHRSMMTSDLVCSHSNSY